MRRFGYNTGEAFLAVMGKVCGLLMIVFAIVALCVPSWFGAEGFYGGILVLGTMVAGVVLSLGSAGVRQNRSALDLGFFLTLLSGLGWIVLCFICWNWVPLVIGLVLLIMLVLCWLARREGIRSRFTPRFFSLRQFETMVAIADVMMDTEDATLHPIEIAIRTDHLLARIDSPLKQNISLVMFMIEWVTPILILRPFPFSDLGTNERRKVVQKVIWSKGMFRDVARVIKLLVAFPYYTHPEARRDIGYIDFDDRERAKGVDQTPKKHTEPTGGTDETV